MSKSPGQSLLGTHSLPKSLWRTREGRSSLELPICPAACAMSAGCFLQRKISFSGQKLERETWQGACIPVHQLANAFFDKLRVPGKACSGLLALTNPAIAEIFRKFSNKIYRSLHRRGLKNRRHTFSVWGKFHSTRFLVFRQLSGSFNLERACPGFLHCLPTSSPLPSASPCRA